MEGTSETAIVVARRAERETLRPEKPRSRSRGRNRSRSTQPPPTERNASPSWSQKPWLTLHRKGSHMFRNAPLWIKAQGTARWLPMFKGSRYTVQKLLKMNPNLLFVIVNDYPGIVSDLAGDGTVQDRPRATTMLITSSSLVLALTTLAKQVPLFEKAFFNEKGIFEKGIEAPYHCFYVMFRNPGEIDVTGLTETMRGQLKELRSYLDLEYLPVYRTASELIAQGKVSEATMPFLASPGTVLVKKTPWGIVCFTATNWPRLSKSYFTERHSAHGSLVMDNLNHSGSVGNWSAKVSQSSDDSPSRLLAAQAHDTFHDSDVWHWEIPAKTLKFQDYGHPELLRCINKLTDTIERGRTLDIAGQLHVYPLHMASAEIQDLIDKRSRKFFQCLKTLYAELESPLGAGSSQERNPGRYMVDFTMVDETMERKSDDDATLLVKQWSDLAEYPDDQSLYVCPAMIPAFSMQSKKWLEIELDRVQPVRWNKLAFRRLAIPLSTKDVIQALVTKQLSHDKSTDFIGSKGNGLLILLHGGPGTGKTVTAESIADLVERPLYRVTGGDIGTTPKAVEENLDEIFHLGHKWGCIVLLDEADVFLQERSLDDLNRNALISVFLRMLEYNDAIVILTSNRVGDFDEAFKSRIQLAIRYNDLYEWQREKIWLNFFEHISEVSPEEIDLIELKGCIPELKKHRINGRQIRNIVTTARQLALFRGKMFGQEELDKAIKVSLEFDKYLDDVRNAKEDDEIRKAQNLDSAWARGNGIR